MGKKDPKIYCLDILNAANKIEEYVGDINDAVEFKENNKTFDAVVRNFEIIGEAANRIPLEIRENYPDIRWRDMIGMRNILAHEYDEIVEEVIWDTIKEDIPKLKALIKHVLDELEK